MNSSTGLIKSDLKDEYNDRQGEINVKVTVCFYLCNTSINKPFKYYPKRLRDILQQLTYEHCLTTQSNTKYTPNPYENNELQSTELVFSNLLSAIN